MWLNCLLTQGGNVYTIIGKPNCIWCDKAKLFMLDKKLDYNYVDLHENIWVAAIMMKGGYKKVPLIIYQTEVVGGYTELEEYYKGKTYG